MILASPRDLLGWGNQPTSAAGISLSAHLGTLASLNRACLLETLLYGIHVVLFCVAIFVIVKNNPETQKIFLVSLTLMFGLSTADMFFTFRVLLKDVPLIFEDRTEALVARVYPKSPIFVSNNCIADFLLLYRCFMIWGRQPYIAIASSILLIADTVWGWIGAGSPVFSLAARFAPVYYWTVFATNIIMTGATAGRIYYMANVGSSLALRQSSGTRQRYHTAIAILVESGLVYSMSLLGLILTFGNPNLRVLFAGIAIRLVSIMPTLMIVQVKLGCSIPTFDAENSKGPTASRVTIVGRGTVGTVVNIPHHASRSRNSFDSDLQMHPRGAVMITHTTHKHTDSLPYKGPEAQAETDIAQQKTGEWNE